MIALAGAAILILIVLGVALNVGGVFNGKQRQRAGHRPGLAAGHSRGGLGVEHVAGSCCDTAAIDVDASIRAHGSVAAGSGPGHQDAPSGSRIRQLLWRFQPDDLGVPVSEPVVAI